MLNKRTDVVESRLEGDINLNDLDTVWRSTLKGNGTMCGDAYVANSHIEGDFHIGYGVVVQGAVIFAQEVGVNVYRNSHVQVLGPLPADESLWTLFRGKDGKPYVTRTGECGGTEPLGDINPLDSAEQLALDYFNHVVEGWVW